MNNLAAAALGSALLAFGSLGSGSLQPPAGSDDPGGSHVLHVAPRAKESGLAQAGRQLSTLVQRLWQREEPAAAQGNAKAAQGDPAGALQEYDEAEKHLPQTGDASAALAFDKSSQLLKQDADQAPKAMQEAHRALESSDPSLRAKAAYNAAWAAEQAGKQEEAIEAYGRALSLDSEDVDSKVNLELLLKTEEQKKKQQTGPQDPNAQKKPQQGKDEQQKQQADGQKKDEQQKQQEKKPGDKEEEKDQQKQEQAGKDPQKEEQQRKEEQQQKEQQDKAQKEEKAQEQQAQARLGRSDAQRLLDAARAGEKNLQVWRFGKRSDQKRRKSAVEKDW